MKDKLREELLKKATQCEIIFQDAAKQLGVKLTPQFRVTISSRRTGVTKRAYFADFCDVKNKMIFEIDGGYHFTEEQTIKDLKRTRELSKLGYRVFRIPNSDVLAGKSGDYIYSAYLFIGIDIMEKQRAAKARKERKAAKLKKQLDGILN